MSLPVSPVMGKKPLVQPPRRAPPRVPPGISTDLPFRIHSPSTASPPDSPISPTSPGGGLLGLGGSPSLVVRGGPSRAPPSRPATTKARSQTTDMSYTQTERKGKHPGHGHTLSFGSIPFCEKCHKSFVGGPGEKCSCGYERSTDEAAPEEDRGGHVSHFSFSSGSSTNGVSVSPRHKRGLSSSPTPTAAGATVERTPSQEKISGGLSSLGKDEKDIPSRERSESENSVDRERRESVIYMLEETRKKQARAQERKKRTTLPAEKPDPKAIQIDLPRGGTYVNTNMGPIQFGIPPETIKDSMTMGLNVPLFFVLPKERFNLHMGMNVAEFEFPCFFNFFLKKSKTTLIIHKEVELKIRAIFQEALLGPAEIPWPEEYSEDVPRDAYPDLVKELSYFSKNPMNPTEQLSVDTLLSFVFFDKDGVAKLDKGVEVHDQGTDFVVMQDAKKLATISGTVYVSPPLHQIGDEKKEKTAFIPPYFGVTMLGNSDGFDANGSTTGFVLWMNRRGIMVDPPPHSGALLRRLGILPRLIRGVILTHCHADHDAGTFQKILEEGRVVVMTTETILGSFLRKYSAISGLDVDFLQTLFVFRPVVVGEKIGVYGGQLQFFYSLHAIPCVGFSAYCNGKSMIYSADTFNDEKGIQKFYELGLMSKARRDKLINFGWHHDLILHEAGVPPIHTPLTTFENLPPDVKKRLYLVHTKNIPEGKGFQRALVGPENTIVISNEKGPGFQEMEVLDLVGNIDIFSRLVVSRGVEIISCAKYKTYKEKEVIIRENTTGATMFVVAMGTVGVTVSGSLIKNLDVGDHFGEMSILMGGQRSATITALTAVEVIVFTKHDFLHIVRRTDALNRLKQLAIKHRSGRSWQCIEKNSVFKELTSSQKTYLQSLLKKQIIGKGQVIWSAQDVAQGAVLIDQGKYVFSGATDATPFTTGAFIGDMTALLNGAPLYTSLVCLEAGAVYYLSKAHLLRFLDDNPGLRLSFMNRRFVE